MPKGIGYRSPAKVSRPRVKTGKKRPRISIALRGKPKRRRK